MYDDHVPDLPEDAPGEKVADSGPPPHPWFSIWFRPRATIRYILDVDDPRGIWMLPVIASLAVVFLPEKHLYELAEELDWPMTIGILGLASATAGVAGLYLTSWIGRITGSWLGGTATSSQLRQALAWSMVPQIWISPLAPLTLLLFGREWFEETKPMIEGSGVLSLAYGLLVMVQFVVGVWTVVINMKAIGEAHGFSAWKALLSSMIAAVLIIVTLVVAFFVLIFGVVFIRSLAA
jgi:hypothetical protein